VRTAEAVGASGIIFLGDQADPFDPAVVRASMGGIFRIQLARAGIELFEAWVRRHGCTVVGASPAGSTSYTDVPVDPPLVVLLGEERVGLSPRETAVATHLARIPMVGTADSLNVGVAAGVMLYEILRRRGPDPLTREPSSRGCP
jgi:TrmH family RNA methyltransferase